MPETKFEPEISRSLKKIALDIIVEKPIAIECKRESGTSLSFSRVEESQVKALLDFTEVPLAQKLVVAVGQGNRFKRDTGFDFLLTPKGKAYVLVNFRATKKAGGKEIPKGTNRCFALSIHDYVDGMESLLEEGRKSFPFRWFVDNAIEIRRISWEVGDKKVYGWNLIPLAY